MAGKIKQLLGRLADTRGRGAAGAHFLRSHLILKGINPDSYADDSPDDPAVIAELEEETGRVQGRIVRALVPGGGRLLFVEGTRRSLTARGRTAGLQDALQDASIEMDRLEAGWTAEDGQAAAHRWLRIAMQVNRALDLIVCHNDSLAAGVRGALEKVAMELERPEARQIPIVGCDGAPELGLAMVREGSLTATVVQPRPSGDAVDSIARVLRGGPLPPPVSRLAGTAHPEDILFTRGAGQQVATAG